MKEQKNITAADSSERCTAKLPYLKPKLQVFGKVHHLTQGSMNNNTDSAGFPANTMGNCERRLKESIVEIGRHPLGISLYLFDYKPEFRDDCGHGRQFGVMAEEVERVMPEAVSFHSNGYKQVNYSLLNIRPAVN